MSAPIFTLPRITRIFALSRCRCGKVSHASVAAAHRAMLRILADPDKDHEEDKLLNVYYCAIGDAYHVGHKHAVPLEAHAWCGPQERRAFA